MAVASVLSQTTPYGDIDIGVKFIYVYGTITLSGSYVTGGDTWDLTALSKPINHPGIPSGTSGAANLPTQVYIQGVNGNSYAYVKGTTRANGKLKCFAPGGTEAGAVAYPAGFTGDTITFQAVFPRF